MDIYLPIAGMSINFFLIIGIGALVGFLSGMFGVGGGFLLIQLRAVGVFGVRVRIHFVHRSSPS